VVNLDGDFYAVEDKCTHEDYELSAGSVDAEEGSVECVLHGARFDLRSGRALCGPAYLPVAHFPVQVADGVVWTRDDR
jgi:3-phenylpropionate/trans-cinnamate dioxygenase ferredoxin subunit